jgi:hypothetical protein
MGEIDGSLAYNGPAFDQAVAYFSPVPSDPAQNPYIFTVGNISYESVPVPEPTTMIAGALLLLPVGASTLRMLRKTRTA